MTILIAAGILIVSSSLELQRLYRDLFQIQQRDTLAFYLMFSALQVRAFLRSIFPASIFGVLAIDGVRPALSTRLIGKGSLSEFDTITIRHVRK